MKLAPELVSQLSASEIVILGLGREGWSTYCFLRHYLPEKSIILIDQQELSQLKTTWQSAITTDPHLTAHLGVKAFDQLDAGQLIIKTPGIPATHPALTRALAAGSQLTSNLALFFAQVNWLKKQLATPIQLDRQFIDQTFPNLAPASQPSLSTTPLLGPLVIGVTGTKGKSTTASAIAHLLSTAGLSTLLMGNIGRPALDYLDQITGQTRIVIELSSHQLAELTTSPDLAVIQAVTSEHLDYYANTAAYVAAKESISRYQKVNQYTFYYQNSPAASQIAQLSSGTKIPFVSPNSDTLVYIKDDYLILKDIKSNHNQTSPLPLCQLSALKIFGRHNLTNLVPAILIARLHQLKLADYSAGLTTFQPLPHRLELVAVHHQVTYINDSLATMPDAAIAALQSFADQLKTDLNSTNQLILLAGGYERHQDFSQLAATILAQPVKALLLFPPTGARLANQVTELATRQQQPPPLIKFVTEMPTAVALASQLAQPGDIVLLSPAAASFGTFVDYRDRGHQFKTAVKALA